MAKLPFERILLEIDAAGYEYLEGDYKNLDSILTVKCKQGHKVLFSLKQLRGKKECPVCESYQTIEAQEKVLATPTKKRGIRVLALDQATEKSGYVIMENEQILDYGIKEIKNKETSERIIELRQWLVSMIRQWEIDYVGLENIYYSGNPQTLISLGRLLGALEATAYEATKNPAMVIAPATWRSYCGIKGKTRFQQKENAQNFIKNKFNIVASQDAADAICLGLCISNQVKFEKQELIRWD